MVVTIWYTSVSSSSSMYTVTLSYRPTWSAPEVSSNTLAVLIMFSRKRMRLSLRFFSCLAALYSKFSLRSPKARASFTASSSLGRRVIRR